MRCLYLSTEFRYCQELPERLPSFQDSLQEELHEPARILQSKIHNPQSYSLHFLKQPYLSRSYPYSMHPVLSWEHPALSLCQSPDSSYNLPDPFYPSQLKLFRFQYRGWCCLYLGLSDLYLLPSNYLHYKMILLYMPRNKIRMSCLHFRIHKSYLQVFHFPNS